MQLEAQEKESNIKPSLVLVMERTEQDLKNISALKPLGQKHTVWNRTGKLSLTKRNALTTEPRLRT